jgi:HD superfamily phosphodiesterase
MGHSTGPAVAAVVRHPLIDEILDARREYARGDTAGFEGYRNHAHRVYNFARSIASTSPEDDEKTAIAAAFHDLFVFDGLDYIEPSIEEAGRYLREAGRAQWDREVALVIAFHHPVRPYRGDTHDSWSRFAARTGTTSPWGS